MESFTAAPHHDVLVLIIQIAVLLSTARALGEIAQRLGQPAVIGEILAGIVLGPSLLSGFFPFINAWIVPQTEVQGYLLEVISLIGVMFLLLITGLETDLPLIRRHARTAIGTAAGGLIVPFATGLLLGLHLPDFFARKQRSAACFCTLHCCMYVNFSHSCHRQSLDGPQLDAARHRADHYCSRHV